MKDKQPLMLDIQGHRGARGLWPENTLKGFAATLELGVNALELDVGVSRDGVLMVHHDLILNPMTTRDRNGHWLADDARPAIHDLSAAELQDYEIGTLQPETTYAQRYPQQLAIPGARIPTLQQVVELLHEHGDERVRLNVEAKLDPRHPQLTARPEVFARLLVNLLRETDMTARAAIQSFDWRVQACVLALDEHIATGFLSEQHPQLNTVADHGDHPSAWTNGMRIADFQGSVPRMVKAAGGAVWSPDFQSLDEQRLREAQTLGLRVVVWTVNTVSDITRMIGMGVDGVISDYPNRVRDVACKLGLRVPASTQRSHA
ncbi:MAG: glycerophosphoryl diester phosphodiesterase [Gammaproteobacteria bacterium]|jgi:glycerophosphoryl diester phosphodiesterase